MKIDKVVREHYEAGRLDDAARELMRYGTITWDVRHTDEDAVDWRFMLIELESREWEIIMRNGEVTQVGWDSL